MERKRCECGQALLETSDEICEECFALEEYYQDKVRPLNFNQQPAREEEPEEADTYATWDWGLEEE